MELPAHAGSSRLDEALLPLLDYLVAEPPAAAVNWRGWHLLPIGGGVNNLLYRARGPVGDLAVKFTIRDERKRAEREFAALSLLRQTGLAISPRPLLLLTDRYPQPVVVQSWLAGRVSEEPPASDGEWRALLRHLALFHAITPSASPIALRPAVLNMSSAGDGLERIEDQLAHIPDEERPAGLEALVERARQSPFASWPAPRQGLCRSDPNTRNFVRRRGRWASVDWENSGWGDPAFEIADLMAHPAYAGVPQGRWPWVLETYASLAGDGEVIGRTHVYYRLAMVWWVVRLARALYEWPRDLDVRLAARPASWESDTRARYERYLERARELITGGPLC